MIAETPFEVVVLGSGTSNGVPMLGVEYPPAFLAEPRNHRTRSSILVAAPGGNILVDCTPEMRIQLTREGVLDVAHVILTHTHADHVMGLDDLRSLSLRRQSRGLALEMPISTLPRYQEEVRRVFGYAFRPAVPGTFVPRLELRDALAREEIAGVEVRTATVAHGATPVLAVRVGGFGYATDCSRIEGEAEEMLTGLDVLMLDATRLKAHPNHFNLEGAVAEAARLRARRTFLTHLSHDYDAANPPALPPGVELAYDGLRLRFPQAGSEAKEVSRGES